MIKGSLVPNITIFDADGKIDDAKTCWHMRWMFEKGVDGLFLTGSYGAGPLMTHDERVHIFKLAKEVAAEFGGKTLFGHVGCVDTKGTVALAQAAQEVGLDAVSSVPPFYYKYTDEEILRFYTALIKSVDIPVFAYNNPSTTRFTFNAGIVRKLQEVGLKGLKDSPLAVGFLSVVQYEAKHTGKDFQVIIGSSTGWLPYYYMGVEAMIAGMNNYAPEIIAYMLKATVAGEKEKAEKAYLAMMKVSKAMHFTDSTIATHMALYARGFDAGFARQPFQLPPFSDPQYGNLLKMLQTHFDELGLELTTGDHKIS
jgi:dihydrodipicolinate synthase/N-acetylneuraminate lyase